MNYELIPPTEDFFSQQWYDRLGFGTAMITDDLYSRIDSTRRKLNELEAKLGQRMNTDIYNPDLRSFWDRVGWLRHYIGVWHSRSNNDGRVIGWYAEMVYPNNRQVISQCPQNLFGERKEDAEYFILLLSPSVVNWLNAVDKWVSTVDSTTTYDYAST